MGFRFWWWWWILPFFPEFSFLSGSGTIGNKTRGKKVYSRFSETQAHTHTPSRILSNPSLSYKILCLPSPPPNIHCNSLNTHTHYVYRYLLVTVQRVISFFLPPVLKRKFYESVVSRIVVIQTTTAGAAKKKSSFYVGTQTHPSTTVQNNLIRFYCNECNAMYCS